MNQKRKIFTILSALTLAGTWGATAWAQGEVYTLNPVVVTATRTEKEDLDVPASTTVITAKEIKDKGYVSVFDALNSSIGVDSYNYGAGAGDDYGGSSSRFYIRGMDKGTLVLVNGAPVNLNNYSGTEGIPLAAVEKIEVIKGSNSVLYGAEAMGGVVNIITKHDGKPGGYVQAKYGNYDSGYEVGLTSKDYAFYFTRDYSDTFDDASLAAPGRSYNWKNRKGNKSSLYMSAKINDRLNLDWSHVDSTKHHDAMQLKGGKRTGNLYSSMGNYNYDSQRNNINLIYNDKDHEFKSILAFNNRRLDSHQYALNSTTKKWGTARSTNYNVYNITFDNQKVWHFNDDKDSLTGGMTFKREHWNELENTSERVHRDSYSLYSSYDHHFNDKFSTIIGVRGESFKSNGWDKEQKVFLPQWQMLYKMNDKWSWYTNIGKSFDMPAINSRYGSGHSRTKPTSYKPQKGWSYEMGTKYISGKDSLKIDVFHMDIEDYFKWVKGDKLGGDADPNSYYQLNEGKFKNTGIEAEWRHSINENWTYNLGVSVSDPKLKEQYGSDKDKWVQEAAKIQTNAGILYHKDKWNAGLNLYYTGEREYAGYRRDGKSASTYGYDHRTPSRINLTSAVSYSPDKNQTISLNMYNLLDRKNPINKYENWDLPYNWTLTYRYSF